MRNFVALFTFWRLAKAILYAAILTALGIAAELLSDGMLSANVSPSLSVSAVIVGEAAETFGAGLFFLLISTPVIAFMPHRRPQHVGVLYWGGGLIGGMIAFVVAALACTLILAAIYRSSGAIPSAAYTIAGTLSTAVAFIVIFVIGIERPAPAGFGAAGAE